MATLARMFVLLNGPLGIGKSTLAEALGEFLPDCTTLHGDALNALNPPPTDDLAYLHGVLALLVEHHRRHGYRHFVIEHYWPSADRLADLTRRLVRIDPGEPVHCFRLTLPEEENRRRIERRQAARAIDERELEWRWFADEHATLAEAGFEFGEPFDVSDPPDALVGKMLERLGLAQSSK